MPSRSQIAFYTLPLVLSLALLGCPLGHQSPPARAQEAASELNLNARFGRMELAAEHVDPKARNTFFERRRTWGGQIRVADYELSGVRMQGEEDADVFVRIAWFRVNEGDLRATTLKQKWHDFKGDWRLTDEVRLDGDVGLLGEPIENVKPSGGPRNVQFPTLRLGAKAQAPETNEPSEAPAETTAPAAAKKD